MALVHHRRSAERRGHTCTARPAAESSLSERLIDEDGFIRFNKSSLSRCLYTSEPILANFSSNGSTSSSSASLLWLQASFIQEANPSGEKLQTPLNGLLAQLQTYLKCLSCASICRIPGETSTFRYPPSVMFKELSELSDSDID